MTGQRKCEPCSPGFLQPLQGQTACLPCPASGVDCTVQNAVEVDTGWFRALDGANSSSTSSGLFDAAAGGTIGLTVYNISLTVAASLDDFSTSAFEERLRSFLPCPATTCGMALSVEAGSVLVRADVADTMGASAASAVMLTTMSTTELETALNVTVEGVVRVRGGRAVSLLSSDAMAPVRCPHPESCLGGAASACAEGHTGALCGECLADYFRGDGTCAQCTDRAVPSIALYAGSAAAMLLGALGYIYLQLRRANNRRSSTGIGGAVPPPSMTANRCCASLLCKRMPDWALCGSMRSGLRILLARLRRRDFGTMLKILLAYGQVMQSFSRMANVRWPPAYRRFLERFAVFSLDFFSVSPLGCTLGVQVGFLHEMLAVLALPAVGATLLLLMALLAQCIASVRKHSVCEMATRPETVDLLLWLFFLLYPLLAKTALVPFDCVDVGDQRLMRASPGEACDEDEWYLLGALGGAGTVVYSFGFPLLCFVMTRAAHNAPSGAILGDGVDDKKVGRARRRIARARLLLRSYRPKYWYWEALEVLRKYFLTSVVLVVAPSSLVQVYMGLLVCMASTILVALHQPYADPFCGALQFVALMQLTITYMSGMLFFDNGSGVQTLPPEQEEQFGEMLIVANLLVFATLGIGLANTVRLPPFRKPRDVYDHQTFSSGCTLTRHAPHAVHSCETPPATPRTRSAPSAPAS